MLENVCMETNEAYILVSRLIYKPFLFNMCLKTLTKADISVSGNCICLLDMCI